MIRAVHLISCATSVLALFIKFEKALELAQPGLDVNNLALNGNEIMKLGYKGKEIGEIKEKLLEMILDGKVKNSKNELLNIVKKNRKISKAAR